MAKKSSHLKTKRKEKSRPNQAQLEMAAGLYNEAVVKQGAGELEAAAALYRRSLKQNHQFLEAYVNLGNVLIAQQKWSGAEKVLNAAKDVFPDQPVLLGNLGHVLRVSGKKSEARLCLQQSVDGDVTNPLNLNNLGSLLAELGEWQAAEGYLKQALFLQPSFVDAAINLANLYFDIERFEQAEERYRQALRYRVDDPALHYGLGNALFMQDRLDQAADAFLAAIDLKSDYAEAYFFLSQCQLPERMGNAKESMDLLCADKSVGDDKKVYLNFGLGKIYEEQGDFEKSAAFYVEGNRLKRALINYSNDPYMVRIEALKSFFGVVGEQSEDFLGDNTGSPIFVLGTPRAGKTLFEYMLANLTDAVAGGELGDFPKSFEKVTNINPEKDLTNFLKRKEDIPFEEIGRVYLGRLEQRYGSNVVINTAPSNVLYAGLIAMSLPGARFYRIKRDTSAVSQDIYKKLFASGHEYAYDMTEIRRYLELTDDLLSFWEWLLPGRIYTIEFSQMLECDDSWVGDIVKAAGLKVRRETCVSEIRERFRVIRKSIEKKRLGSEAPYVELR
jgi:Tfp pilus assembly protein PilF